MHVIGHASEQLRKIESIPHQRAGFHVIAVRTYRREAFLLSELGDELAVGGGVEWAFWQNWSAKVEYDYYDFSTRNLALPGTIFGVPEIVPGINVKETISTVKFGVNYRFGPY